MPAQPWFPAELIGMWASQLQTSAWGAGGEEPPLTAMLLIALELRMGTRSHSAGYGGLGASGDTPGCMPGLRLLLLLYLVQTDSRSLRGPRFSLYGICYPPPSLRAQGLFEQ